MYAEGETPVLLVAHLDTVHSERPSIICRSEEGRYIMSPQGIGGDDRCGVYMILQIIQNARCHVLFCEDEEIGGRGAKAFEAAEIKVAVNYIIEMDRHGNNDAVFYNCNNPEFTEFVCSFGFREAIGSFSDISIVAPYLKTAAVNISAGYYNEHRPQEIIDSDAMHHNIERITRMVQTPTEKYAYIRRSRLARRCFFQQTLFGSDYEEREKEKLLMELPQGARLMLNGCEITPACTYLLDRDGNVYAGIPELDAAVLSESAVACDSAGEMIPFSVFDAKRMKVLSMESAMEQLAMEASF